MKSPAWERLARENAEFYIATWDVDFSDPEAMARFFESGRSEAMTILEECAPWLRGRAAALEIGCGVGRLTIPMAREFREVLAIDIAPTMLERLRANCAREGITNVVPLLSNERPPAKRVDLVYSRIVLQHIEHEGEVRRYLELVAAILEPDGIAHLHFDTRPAGIFYRARALVPDRFLRRTWRRGIRRVRRSRARVAALAAAAGLEIVKELRPCSAEHVFLLRSRGGV